MLRSISAVTFSVSEFDASCDALRSLFGYERVDVGVISDELAQFWRAPATAGARFAVHGPASREPVHVRFVEQAATPGYEPFRTFGWNAAELHVRDVHGLAGSLAGSSVEILGGPRDLLGNGTAVALQVKGPSQEVYYLTEINGDNMQRTYGRAVSDVDRVFITVLGARDHDAARTFYASLTKATPRPRRFPIRVLAAAHGLDPTTTKFPIGSAILDEQFRIEIDGYPDSATVRPTMRDSLPPGLCVVSFISDDAALADLEPVAEAAGFDMAPYFGRAVRLYRGPDGEWIEVVRSANRP